MASISGKPSKSPVLEATFNGNLTLLKELTQELDDGKGKAKVITSIKNGHGESVLHLAARKGYIDICKYLISDLGVPIDTKEAKGATALLLASVMGHKDIAVYLLEKAANPNISDECGCTPLHHAAFEGHEEFLRHLLSKGANVDALSTAGTPLQRATLRGHQGAIKILLDHHANPNLTFHGCFTALLNSIITKSLHSVELLLQAGADPNAASCGVTPLEIAVSNEDTDIVSCLLKAGANPNVTSVVGETPVEISVRTGNTEAFQILFPVTSPIPTYSDWSYGGILKHTNSEEGKIQMALKQKEKFAEAKSEGNKAFQGKDYLTAIFWYTKVISADYSQATFLSNRSLCFAHLKNGEAALSDAMDCIKLKPEWPKAYYREGAAWNVLRKFDRAANAFLKGMKLDPENKELQIAYQEAMVKFICKT